MDKEEEKGFAEIVVGRGLSSCVFDVLFSTVGMSIEAAIDIKAAVRNNKSPLCKTADARDRRCIKESNKLLQSRVFMTGAKN